MVEEILDYIRENQKKSENSKTKKRKRYTKISFVGYSLGGLWCRYAIGELYKRNILIKNKITSDQQHQQQQQQPLDNYDDIKLEPIIYNTFATPHLGSKFQGSKFKAKLFNTVGGSILGYSGKDLFLKPAKETGSECVITGSNNYNDDDENANVSSQQNGSNLAQDTKDEDIVDESELPLLYIMTDPSREFYKGLALFKHRILYSNAVNDRTVPFFTSYISVQDPFKKKGHVIKRMTFATAIDGNSASSSSTHSADATDDNNDYIEGTIIDTKWSRYVVNPKQPSEELKEIFNRIHKKQEEKRKVLRAAKKKRAQQKLAASPSSSASPIGPNTTSKKVIATKYKNIVLVKEDHLFQKTQKNALSTVLFVGSLLFPVIIMVSTVVSLISQYRVNTITSKEKQLNGDQEAISKLYSSGNPYDEDEGDETTGEDSTKRRRRRSVIGDEVAELTGEAVDGFAPGNTASSKKEGDDGENGQSIIDPDDEDFLQLHHTHSHVEDEVEEGAESDEEEDEDSDDEDVDYDEEDLESLNHLESELHSLQQENYSNGVPLLAEKRLEEDNDDDYNDCQFAKEIPRLNLSPIVQKMAHNLNSLTWDKRIVMLTNYLNAHGPMINRRQLHKRDGRIVNDWAKSLVSKL